MADYIPGSDGSFDTWQGVFVTYVVANVAALGVDPLDAASLNSARNSWTSAFIALGTAQASAQSARQTKDDSRDGLESAVRALVRQLQSNPAVTDAQRQAMGITVYDATRSATASPTTRPLVTVDSSQRLRHVIAFVDEATPTKKAKPAGVMGAEIWVKIGDPVPINPSELSFLSVDTRTPYSADFDGADGGKTAHYMLRWTNARGEQGPWSETASATIGA
jgi:hypothetical protein